MHNGNDKPYRMWRRQQRGIAGSEPEQHFRTKYRFADEWGNHEYDDRFGYGGRKYLFPAECGSRPARSV